MSELSERHKLTNSIPDPQIKLNEVVIIKETYASRSRWNFGQVEKFVTKKDWFNRGGKLRVIGKRRHYFIKRSVNKLYPQEIRNPDNSVIKNIRENDDVIDYGRASRERAETETLIRLLNKQKQN